MAKRVAFGACVKKADDGEVYYHEDFAWVVNKTKPFCGHVYRKQALIDWVCTNGVICGECEALPSGGLNDDGQPPSKKTKVKPVLVLTNVVARDVLIEILSYLKNPIPFVGSSQKMHDLFWRIAQPRGVALAAACSLGDVDFFREFIKRPGVCMDDPENAALKVIATRLVPVEIVMLVLNHPTQTFKYIEGMADWLLGPSRFLDVLAKFTDIGSLTKLATSIAQFVEKVHYEDSDAIIEDSEDSDAIIEDSSVKHLDQDGIIAVYTTIVKGVVRLSESDKPNQLWSAKAEMHRAELLKPLKLVDDAINELDDAYDFLDAVNSSKFFEDTFLDDVCPHGREWLANHIARDWIMLGSPYDNVTLALGCLAALHNDNMEVYNDLVGGIWSEMWDGVVDLVPNLKRFANAMDRYSQTVVRWAHSAVFHSRLFEHASVWKEFIALLVEHEEEKPYRAFKAFAEFLLALMERVRVSMASRGESIDAMQVFEDAIKASLARKHVSHSKKHEEGRR